MISYLPIKTIKYCWDFVWLELAWVLCKLPADAVSSYVQLTCWVQKTQFLCTQSSTISGSCNFPTLSLFQDNT